MSALEPLFNYFNENFAIMKETLTDPAMIMVMTRLWKEVLATTESLLVPPLSDKPSQQRPLTQQELDIVFKWLKVSTNYIRLRPLLILSPLVPEGLLLRRRRGSGTAGGSAEPKIPRHPVNSPLLRLAYVRPHHD